MLAILLNCSDEPCAFINSKFQYKLENLGNYQGKQVFLNQDLQYPLLLWPMSPQTIEYLNEQINSAENKEFATNTNRIVNQNSDKITTIDQSSNQTLVMMLHNVNGCRSGNMAYEIERDQRLTDSDLLVCPHETCLKLGAYLVPDNYNQFRMFNELVQFNENHNITQNQAQNVRAIYPWSRQRTAMVTHVDDFYSCLGVNSTVEQQKLEQQLQNSGNRTLTQNNAISNEYQLKSGEWIVLESREFRGIENHFALAKGSNNDNNRKYSEKPLCFQSQLLYQSALTKKYNKNSSTKCPQHPIPITLIQDIEKELIQQGETESLLKQKQSFSGGFQYMSICNPNQIFNFSLVAGSKPTFVGIKACEQLMQYLTVNYSVLDLTPLVHYDSELDQVGHTLITHTDGSLQSGIGYSGSNTFWNGALAESCRERPSIEILSVPDIEGWGLSESLRSHDQVRRMLINMYGMNFNDNFYESNGITYTGTFESIMGDNSSICRIMTAQGLSKRARSLNTSIINAKGIIQRKLRQNHRYISKIDTNDNSANIHTKALPGNVFQKESKQMGMINLGQPDGPLTSIEEVNKFIGKHLDYIMEQQQFRCKVPYGWTSRTAESIRDYPL